MIKYLGTLLVILSFFAEAQDLKYPVSAIPESLKADANVVIRESEETFVINSESSATNHVREVITILNSQGAEFAKKVIGYSKLRKVLYFKSFVYDSNGKLISKTKSSEIYDQSAYDGNLFSDLRLKMVNLSQGSYPYTVEFDYEIEYKFLFYIPSFYLVPDEKVSVERATCTLIYPRDNSRPRYKSTGIDQKPIETQEKTGVNLTWKFENVTPIVLEPFGPSPGDYIPHIDFAPTEFKYEGYAGKMDTWDNFGKWIISLNSGRQELPPTTKSKIKDLTADLSTNEEKVKILYEYLQSKTRYVSIQLGIGGQQPFEAAVVDQNGYGDCKALSNYMVSMLQEIGIKANYTLIYAGPDAQKLDVEFPSTQFNHAIVSVPNGKDTLWLECTSQENPFGYQGRFTGDRKALVITEDGAKVVNTLTYTAAQNVQSRSADVIVDLNGNATAKVRTKYAGTQYENNHLNFILNDQHDKQKEWLQDNMGIPGFNIKSFSITEQKNKIPAAIVTLDLGLQRLASVSGKRLFLTPNLMNRSSFVPEKVDSRKADVVLQNTYTHVDTIRYHLPDGIYPEFLPEPISLKSRFGEYEARFQVDQGSLVYTRKLMRAKGEFPAASYQELIDFYKSVNKADNTKLVFLNKT